MKLARSFLYHKRSMQTNKVTESLHWPTGNMSKWWKITIARWVESHFSPIIYCLINKWVKILLINQTLKWIILITHFQLSNFFLQSGLKIDELGDFQFFLAIGSKEVVVDSTLADGFQGVAGGSVVSVTTTHSCSVENHSSNLLKGTNWINWHINEILTFSHLHQIGSGG